MESNLQPSFIPKKPMSQPGVRAPHKVSFFSLITTIVFITALLIAGGVFGYKKVLSSSLTKKGAELDTELKKFDRTLIDDLTHLDARLNTSVELINKHLSVSAFFKTLGDVTLKAVRYSSFSFTAGVNEKPKIVMDGQAQNFAAVALQAQEFTKKENAKYFQNVVITDPNLDTKGNVTFSFSGFIDTKSLSYPEVLKAQAASGSGTLLNQTPISTSTSSQATTTNRTTSR
jgi:hypothetical protein